MTRAYRLGKRAERAEETRRRIAEAALELHSTVGPARTTVSAIAERAGVQRHTYYAHFPDQYSLGLACSGLHLERSPLPDPERWLHLQDPVERLRHALSEVYGHYSRDEQLLANVLRDGELDPVVREIKELRFGPTFGRMVDVLADGFSPGSREVRAAVALALDFATWRLLVRDRGLSRRRAIDLAVRVVACAARPS